MSITLVEEEEKVIQLVISSDNQGKSYYHMGLNTHRVPMSMHAENRQRLLARFTDAPKGSIIVVKGGVSECRDATDHEPLFRQESYFQWLFGVMEPDFYGALHIDSGRSVLFIPNLPAQYAVWMGNIKSKEVFKKHYEVDEVYFVEELEQFCENQSTNVIYLLQGKNTDSGETHKPPHFPFFSKYTVDVNKLHVEINECRVIKSKEEIEVLRYVCRITSEAHIKVLQTVKPGRAEYQMESEFLHHCYHEGGCRNVSYTCICGSGKNSSILHYGHAGAPNNRIIKDGDLCLFDLGAEYHCYSADITCSFPANGKFTQEQLDIYEPVYAAQQAVFAAMKPGVKWTDMHLTAERAILTVLRDKGYLFGDIDEMVEKRIAAYLMPHGLGHFLGIDTHDVGGYPDGVERIELPGLRSLRTARVLQPGMFITVEPGVYIIDFLLRPVLDSPLGHYFNREKFEHLLDLQIGGVRLEDDVLVTENGIENFTICPRKVEDVEAVMSGAPWPPA